MVDDGDLEKGSGAVEADISAGLDVARQGFVKKTLGARSRRRRRRRLVPKPHAQRNPNRPKPKQPQNEKKTGILSLQLLVTAVIALAVTAWPPLTRLAAGPTSPLPPLAAVASLALVLYLSFSERARHEHPLNLIVLGSFTLAEAVLVGAICAQYTLPSVLLAFAATGASALAVASCAATAKKDLTAHGGALLGALVAFLCVSILAALLRVRMAEGLVAAVGAVLFSVFLATDVQRLYDNQGGGAGAGGGGGGGGGLASSSLRREQAFGPDEHVAAALAIYLDLINMLVYLLRLFGERRE
jgi:FtsH-binding integral membrane protein